MRASTKVLAARGNDNLAQLWSFAKDLAKPVVFVDLGVGNAVGFTVVSKLLKYRALICMQSIKSPYLHKQYWWPRNYDSGTLSGECTSSTGGHAI
eukprot:5213228-Pleurochrysis_carterae.AAC.1